MKKILFNNIGNRHLRYAYSDDGQEKNLYNEKTNFKKISKNLLENYDKEKDKISLEILKQYLDNINDKPDKIILFGTDQEKTATIEEHKNQDTFWAALIIKNIIEEKYNIPTDVIKIEQDPSDEDALVPIYQKYFDELKHKLLDTQWFFLDAGGTPQQKFVCKLLMPEINPSTEIPYLGNVDGIGEQDLRTKKFEEINKIFHLKNSKILLDEGHYRSAWELINKADKSNKALPVIEIASYRMNNIYKNKKNLKKSLLNKEEIKQYNDKIPLSDNKCLKNSLPPDGFFIYTEFIARADHYLKLKNYNRFILTFNQSLENILQSFLLKKIEEKGLNYEGKEREKISQFIKEKLSKDDNNIPNQLELAIKYSEQSVKNIFELYGSINSGYLQYILNRNNIEGLDTMRNHLVHRGKSVDKSSKSFKKIKDTFEKIKAELNFDEGSYKKLNSLAKELLFKK